MKRIKNELFVSPRMGKKKKNSQQGLPTKNGSGGEGYVAAANLPNPEDQRDFPSLQSSVSTTRKISQKKTLEKKMDKMKVSELPVQKVEQQNAGLQSGTKPKTLVYSGGERIGHKVDKMKIYTVSSLEQKVGTVGRKIALRANHFQMAVNVPAGLVYHYHIDFIIPWKKEVKKSDRKLLLETINVFKVKYPKIFPNPHAVVFDGLKNAYTCRMLAFTGREFEGDVEVKEDTDTKVVPVKVKLKYTGSVDINYAVEEYCRRGSTETKPNDATQSLNIVLGMTPQLHCETIGRNYFSPNRRNGTAIDLGGGASLWIGTFLSVRLGWKPMLNVDMASKVGCDDDSVAEFIERVLKTNRDFNSSQVALNDKRHYMAVDAKIKDLKIRYNRPDGGKRDYRVLKMMPAANRLKMKLENGEECTIEKYFKDQYNCQLKFPNYPCVHVGNPSKSIYLPIELCTMKKQVLPLSKRLNDDQSQKMIRAAAKLPKERREIIETNLRNFSNHYDRDPFANSFGLKVSGEMLRVDGRVLEPPALKYKNAESKDIEFRKVNNGKWSVGTRRDIDALKFLKPVPLKHWGLLDLGNLSSSAKDHFVERIYSEGATRGMPVDFPAEAKANVEDIKQVKETFKKLHEHIKNERGHVQLIMVMNTKKGTVRDELKYIGDTILRVPTQFVMKLNIVGKDNRGPSDQIIHNLCLKINHKLGGVTHALSKRPPIMNRPVMVMGADVTHPAAVDISKKPSIAAAVGSTDPNVSQFNVEIRLQYKGEVVEEIEKMEDMTKSLLMKFYQTTRRKPEQILYYRDGVSEGQFPAVLSLELSAIRRACTSLEKGYEPKVTFIIAQKRHRTRFFVENPNDGIGKTKNLPAGTVVDTKITTLSEIDFFLASHEGIQVVNFYCFFFFAFEYTRRINS